MDFFLKHGLLSRVQLSQSHLSQSLLKRSRRGQVKHTNFSRFAQSNLEVVTCLQSPQKCRDGIAVIAFVLHVGYTAEVVGGRE